MYRHFLRNYRYKAVESSLNGLVEKYNFHHLLAVSRVDFKHYTTIFIYNQSDSPDSLSQFRKVMSKDTAEDTKNRPAFKKSKINIANINLQNDNNKASIIINSKLKDILKTQLKLFKNGRLLIQRIVCSIPIFPTFPKLLHPITTICISSCFQSRYFKSLTTVYNYLKWKFTFEIFVLFSQGISQDD